MDLRSETRFVLEEYFTNGFTIWAFLMLITYYSRTEPVIAEFRASLWLEQLMWVFFVPLFAQVVLDLATRIKIQKKFRPFSITMALYVIAASGLLWIFIIDYAFFAGGVILIIGEYQDGEAIKDIEKYNFMNSLGIFSGLFIMPVFSIIIHKITRYLIEQKIIYEKKFSFLTPGNKISIFCMIFSLTLCSFVIYHDILKL